MVKGYNQISVTCTSPAKGDASVRVYWSGEGFAWEPLPPDLLFSRKDDANLASASSIREGRLLFATRGCAHCHKLSGKLELDQCVMPEMHQQAPSLDGVGKRLKQDFLAQWIADPLSLRPQAMMPHIFAGPGAPQEAADVAAYLATLTNDESLVPTKSDDELVEKGNKLFLTLGCVTCHRLEAPTEKDEFDRISLHYVSAKFQPGALEAFLRSPQQHYPWIRMPDFKLTTQEIAGLAAYLGSESKGKIDAPLKGDSSRGNKLFQSAGCMQCHTTNANEKLPARSVAFPAIPVKGCLAEDAGARGKAPDFGLSETERRSLRSFLATDLKSLLQETPAEFAQRQMKLLQCNACHTRDGVPGRWYGILTDEGGGGQPEYLPHLTWTGQKLHPEWTEKQVAGTQDHRVRPWIKARMPAFPARAALIAAGLSHEHGYALQEDPRPALGSPSWRPSAPSSCPRSAVLTVSSAMLSVTTKPWRPSRPKALTCETQPSDCATNSSLALDARPDSRRPDHAMTPVYHGRQDHGHHGRARWRRPPAIRRYLAVHPDVASKEMIQKVSICSQSIAQQHYGHQQDEAIVEAVGHHAGHDRSAPLARYDKSQCQSHEHRHSQQALRMNDRKNKAGNGGANHDACDGIHPARRFAQVTVEHPAKHCFLDNGRHDAGQEKDLKAQRPITAGQRHDDGMVRRHGRTQVLRARPTAVELLLQPCRC